MRATPWASAAAGCRSIDDRRRRHGPTGRAPARDRCACPATSRSATGRCCSRRSRTARAGSPGPVTAPTCARPPGSSRPSAPASTASPATGRPSAIASSRPGRTACATRRAARLRELRHEPPPDGGRARRAALTATLDGDDSLRGRPVARIIEPLRQMGAVLHARRSDSLPPLTVIGHTVRSRPSTTPRRSRAPR